VILFIAGLFDSSAEIDRADGIRINLWLGTGDVRARCAVPAVGAAAAAHGSSGGPSAAEQAGISDGPPG
jgi:hypothetical protein